jgi:hypothetical protein
MALTSTRSYFSARRNGHSLAADIPQAKGPKAEALHEISTRVVSRRPDMATREAALRKRGQYGRALTSTPHGYLLFARDIRRCRERKTREVAIV